MASSRRLLAFAFVALAGLPGCFIIHGSLNPFGGGPQPLQEQTVSGEGRDKILIVDVSGMISNSENTGAFGLSSRPSLTSTIREDLERAGEDEHVRAIVLRINSPGGTVTASDMIYHELMAFKATKHVPIVAQMLDMGTSGAYYIALAADEIRSTPTTVTGSVGVIFSGVNFSGLMEKIGIKDQTIKAGANKDVGSPLRPMTPEERALLQTILTDMRSRFVDVVQQRRPKANSEVLDGRILTANQARDAGLIDEIGYLDDAIDAAKTRAQISEAQVVVYRRSQEYAENIYSRSPLGAPQVNLLNIELGALSPAPQFLYMWSPETH